MQHHLLMLGKLHLLLGRLLPRSPWEILGQPLLLCSSWAMWQHLDWQHLVRAR
jgi:hypothetical protein